MVSLRILNRVAAYQFVATLVVSGVCLAFMPGRALAVLVGGAIMSANFLALRLLGERALRLGRLQMGYALLLATKLVLVAGLLAIAVLVLKLDLLGLALGMSMLFVGIGVATLHASSANRPLSETPGES